MPRWLAFFQLMKLNKFISLQRHADTRFYFFSYCLLLRFPWHRKERKSFLPTKLKTPISSNQPISFNFSTTCHSLQFGQIQIYFPNLLAISWNLTKQSILSFKYGRKLPPLTSETLIYLIHSNFSLSLLYQREYMNKDAVISASSLEWWIST